jgi:hypothetical protein
MVYVVGTHTSKSILCPVYYIELRDGVRIWMRYNFFNWNVSIDSDQPITCDFLGVLSNYGYCYCEGMDDKFDEYTNNNKKFTVCVDNHYDLYVFFRVLKQFFKIKPEDQ